MYADRLTFGATGRFVALSCAGLACVYVCVTCSRHQIVTPAAIHTRLRRINPMFEVAPITPVARVFRVGLFWERGIETSLGLRRCAESLRATRFTSGLRPARRARSAAVYIIRHPRASCSGGAHDRGGAPEQADAGADRGPQPCVAVVVHCLVVDSVVAVGTTAVVVDVAPIGSWRRR